MNKIGHLTFSFLAALAAIGCALPTKADGPVLVSPAHQATLDIHFSIKGPNGKLSRKAYLQKSRSERMACYDYLKNPTGEYHIPGPAIDDLRFVKDGTSELSDNFAAPGQVTNVFSWTGTGPFSVTISNLVDKTVFFTTSNYDKTSIALQNFEIARKYRWIVSNASGRASRVFSTSELAPRYMAEPAGKVAGIRDLGGRIGLNGRRVRQNLLFRCSQFSEQDAANTSLVTDPRSQAFWRGLGIKTDLDLRGDETTLTSSPLKSVTGSTGLVKIQGVGPNFLMNASYPNDKKRFATMFNTLSDSSKYPLAFHCKWGKDRTGTLATMLLGVLGCERDEVRKDWEATWFWTKGLGSWNGYDAYDAAIDAQSGSTFTDKVYSYLRGCGVTATQIANFRNIMLESEGYGADAEDDNDEEIAGDEPGPVDPSVATVKPAVIAPNGVTMPTHTSAQTAFMVLDQATRRTKFCDTTYRAALAAGSRPLPTELSWTGNGTCTVVVKDAANATVLTTNLIGNAVLVDNLQLGATYTWSVTNGKGTASGTFATDATAPRLLRDPATPIDATADGKIFNVRDFGGRTGLDGKRVKTGLLFRSSAFDANCQFAGGLEPSETYVTDENRAFYTGTLGIKTDVDLRNACEYGSNNVAKTVGPLGAGVEWVHFHGDRNIDAGEDECPQYGDFHKDWGKAQVKKFLDVFLDPAKYPVDFHCTSGQDRTGCFAFLLGGLLGVDENSLYLDWELLALHNATAGLKSGAPKIDAFVEGFAPYAGATLQEKIEAYVKGVGVIDDQITAFRNLMLEGGYAPPSDDPVVDPTDPSAPDLEGKGWGYVLSGLGDDGKDVALVFTNTAATMSFDLSGVSSIRYLLVGGGGAGGSVSSDSNYSGYGGAGGEVVEDVQALTSPQLAVVVGAGGVKSASTYGAGGDGGASKLTVNDAVELTAKGGAGGDGAKTHKNAGTGGDGAGGVGSAGDGNKGGAGGPGQAITIIDDERLFGAGGGGGATGTGSAAGGAGGTTGGGKGGKGINATGTSGSAGSAGSFYGAGGGGSGGAGYTKGGNGYQGLVIVRYTLPGEDPTPTEHTHQWVETERVAATQMEDGYVTYTCSGEGTCDAGGTKTEALPHAGKFDTLYKTLQTDGVGYFLTDYVPNLRTTRLEMKVRKLDTLTGFFFMANGNTAGLAGKTATSGNEFGLGFWSSVQFGDGKAPGFQYYCELGDVIFARDFCDTVWAHTFDLNGATVTTDGETMTVSATPKDEAAGGPLALFCTAMDSREGIHMSTLRVQYVRVWNGDTLVRDWVPVVKDGVATLYDKVTDRCETVRGGGVFTADNDIDRDYADKPFNEWTRAPSISTSYAAGTAPEFDIGQAAYGSPVSTYTAAQLAMLDGGIYTQVVMVAETDACRALSTSLVFTVTGLLPRTATEAPAIVAPAVGATVLTHTELQRAYLAMGDTERRAAYADAEYRQTLADGKSAPLPTALTWTGDGLTTVMVTRVTGTEKLFLVRELVSVKGANNVLEIENLEIATTYRWTVENGQGKATGTFTTDAEAPRLLRDPGPENIKGVRDLGGRTGLDGKRVRQGLVFRSSQLDHGSDDLSFVNDVNRSFWTDFLGIRTELDFRGGSENAGVTKSPIGEGVNYYKWDEPTASYGFDSYASYRKSFALFLDRNNYPIDFHCAAGQDRTGVFAFLLNALLGVSEDELQKDWEVTAFWNQSVGFCFANYDEFRANLAAAGGTNACEQAENFVIKKLGFTMDSINTFRDIMLESAEEPFDPPVPPVTDEVTTNAMDNASWGYEIRGLGDDHRDVALVFTNTTETMMYDLPSDVSSIRYLVVGGGGAGGSIDNDYNWGGYGGNGGSVIEDTVAITASQIAVEVGGGGSVVYGKTGNDGGSSTLTVNNGGAVLSAAGGAGGLGSKNTNRKHAGNGGAGADGEGGEYDGSNGGAGGSGKAITIIDDVRLYGAGGGGGSKGTSTSFNGGAGGMTGGGAGGKPGTDASTTGKPGTFYGAGGGGSSGAKSTAGGAGYQGVVIIRYTATGDEPQPESKPKVDGKDVEPEAVFETATSAKPIVYPEGATVTVEGEIGAQTIAFGGKTVNVPRYYTATQNGQTVSLALNDNAKPAFENAEGEIAKSGIVVAADGTVSLHLGKTEAKLTYTLVAAPSLDTPESDWVAVGEPVNGDGEAGCDFTDTSASADGRFYRVRVTDNVPASND